MNKEIWCNTCKLKLYTKQLTYFTMKELFDYVEYRLDVLAQEIYGEFGYDTLKQVEKDRVRQILIEEMSTKTK